MSDVNDGYIAALLAEREGYVKRGLPDRVALVDAALAARGYKPARRAAAEARREAAAAAAEETAVDTSAVETADRRRRKG